MNTFPGPGSLRSTLLCGPSADVVDALPVYDDPALPLQREAQEEIPAAD